MRLASAISLLPALSFLATLLFFNRHTIMLLALRESLDDFLVRALAVEGPMTARELHTRAIAATGVTSFQSVYKQLSKLEQQQVVTKVKTLYYINISWALNLHELAQQMLQGPPARTLSEDLLPLPGSKRVWLARNLWSLYDLWLHILLCLSTSVASQQFCSWAEFPWAAIAYNQKRSLVWNSFRLLGKKFYAVLGDACGVGSLASMVLNKLPSEHYAYVLLNRPLLDRATLNHNLVDRPPLNGSMPHRDPLGRHADPLDCQRLNSRTGISFNPEEYLYSIGPYLLAIELTTKTRNRLHELFRSEHGDDSLLSEAMMAVLLEPARLRLVLYHDHHRAVAFQHIIANHFEAYGSGDVPQGVLQTDTESPPPPTC